MKTEIKKLANSEVEIDVVIPHEKLLEYKKSALASLRKSITIDGFRKDSAPDDIVEKHAGKMGLYTEMAYDAIGKAYIEIITEYKIAAIGQPKIEIKKLAPDNDMEATITTAVAPTVELADYKKIAKAQEKTEKAVVSDEELESAIKELRQMRAHDKMHEDNVEHHSHNHREIADEHLPEVSDEFVKGLGQFENVEDFKKKLRDNMATEKEKKEIEKNRIALIDAIIEKSKIDLPNLLIDLEIDRMMERMAHDIGTMGMGFDDYMKRIQKTRDDLRAEWRAQATMNAKTALVLEEIGKKEKLDPSKEEVEAEAKKIAEMYADRSDIDPVRVEAYVTTLLRNQKVFEFLEGKK